MILFGEMGNGKSTTGNACIREILKRSKKKFRKGRGFVSSKSAKAVTVQLNMKFYTNINIMDTPGFNDPDK